MFGCRLSQKFWFLFSFFCFSQQKKTDDEVANLENEQNNLKSKFEIMHTPTVNKTIMLYTNNYNIVRVAYKVTYSAETQEGAVCQILATPVQVWNWTGSSWSNIVLTLKYYLPRNRRVIYSECFFFNVRWKRGLDQRHRIFKTRGYPEEQSMWLHPQGFEGGKVSQPMVLVIGA